MATRLAEILERSSHLAREMAATSEKMTALTEQMAREAERAKYQASTARAEERKKAQGN